MRIVDSSGFVFGELDTLPGCSQVVVSHAVFKVDPSIIKTPGRGSQAHAERLALMRKLGYDYALCTVRADNVPQNKIMERFRWKKLDCFTSDKTGHFLYVYGKQLYEEDFIATRGTTLLKKS